MSTADDLIELAIGAFRLSFAARVFHWNVLGPEFFELHKAFGEDYAALDEDVDRLAERARALGAFFPVSVEPGLEVPKTKAAEDMVKVLAEGHEEAATLIEDIHISADTTTQNLLDELRENHQKKAWMYRSFLGETATPDETEEEPKEEPEGTEEPGPIA